MKVFPRREDVPTQRDALQLQWSRLAKLPSITPPATMPGRRNGNQYLRREGRKGEKKGDNPNADRCEYELMSRNVRKCLAGFVELEPPPLVSAFHIENWPRSHSRVHLESIVDEHAHHRIGNAPPLG